MDLLAAINRGAPPIGLGIFLRDSYVDGPWAWVAVLATRADYAHEAGLAHAAGKQVWLYAMPDQFGPTVWRDGLALVLRRAAECGAVGVIVDPENGWSNDTADQIPAFGAALSDAASTMRVGITSFPSWGPMAALAHASGDACFGVPQIYGQHGAFSASEINGQWARWNAAFGTRLIPAFAMWVPADHPEMGDPATYAAYLARLPRAGGAIGWMSGAIPVHMLAAVRAWNPGGNTVGMLGLAALAWLGRPAGALTIGLAIAALIMALLLTREVVRGA